MKSAFGLLPWNTGPKSKCELTCGSTAVDEMKEQNCVRNYRDSFNRMKAKISPLLRLDSEGEITGSNFCDPRYSNSTEKSSRQSNSFDSGLIKNLSPNKSSGQNAERNVPSFKKSFSVPSVIMPAHQSFPPPSSSSYLRRNSFTSPVAESLPPYSSSSRVLGFDEIFKTKPFSCVISPDVQCNNIDVTSSKQLKTKEPESGYSVIDLHKSKSMCNNKKSMAGGENILRKADHSACGGGKKSKTTGEYSMENSIDSAQFMKKETSPGVPVPKPKRKRSRHRRKRQQKTNCTSFTPTSSSSPVKNDSSINSSVEITPRSFDDKCCRNILKTSPKCQAEAPTPESGASSFSFDSSVSCTVDPDSDHSAVEECFSDDDLIFGECSVVIESPKVSAKKMTQKRKKSGGSSRLVEIQSSETSDNESDSEQKCSALFFSLSVTVSEDEENDSSVDWDLSTSPCQSASDGFTFEFEFNTGLSLDAILGGAPTSVENVMSQELKDINAQWNKFYTSSGGNNGSSTPCQTQQKKLKVCFACDEKLATVHFVGDEDRAGHWHLFALERSRFKRRIDEVERVLAPILSASHRAKVWGKTDLSDTDNIL